MEASLAIPVPLANVPAPSPLAGPCPVCPRIASEFEGWRQAAYWQAQHGRAVGREEKLKEHIKGLDAQIRLLKQKIFGKSSETKTGTETTKRPEPEVPKRPRGQQRGQPIPPKRTHAQLPAVEEPHDLPEEQRRCSCCGLPFAEFPGTEDSEILEVDVKAHRRVIRRKRYRPSCSCPENKPIVTAPPAPRVIPKSKIGVSIWAHLLLDKYLFYRPTYRLLEDLRLHGLDLSLGSITAGLKRLEPLFTPLYDALVERSQQQTFWHADETRWQVFVTIEGKVGHRWYLWVFHSPDAVVFVLSPTRAHEVPEEHFGEAAEGILVVDRYSAYKAIEQVKSGAIVLAFCWAHVRRDFLRVEKGVPEHAEWAAGWVERIGLLYHLNKERLKASEPIVLSPPRMETEQQALPPPRTEAEQRLRDHVDAMAKQRDDELAQPDLPLAKSKVLESLKDHWNGLTVFVDHPEVPLDNNTAERAQRGPVVGRKNYYGSGAEWSGRLAAMLFSLFQTLSLANLNPRLWLTAYLNACAAAGGQAPADAAKYLPWNLSDEQKREWSTDREPPSADTS
jgi:transposase